MSSNLNLLEEESISIIRDTFPHGENPVILYSIGKDSSVLLHLFKKAFHPLNIPCKIMHIDTTWKFKEMIAFRNKIRTRDRLDLLVYSNLEGVKNNVTPFNNEKYTDIMKTAALKEALTLHKFDMVYGGARRDEEASRSKERILSIRNKFHIWDPTNQRVEPWNIFNTYKNSEESFRVFPLSNWTELNIWQYIKKQKIEIVPLYFSKKRKVVIRGDEIYLLDDERFEIKPSDIVTEEYVRFRTLGCYPLTSGIRSKAKTLDGIIRELNNSNLSERSGRLIDLDKEGSMELKKKEGYF